MRLHARRRPARVTAPQGSSNVPSTMSWRCPGDGVPAACARSHALRALGRIRTCAPVAGDLLGRSVHSATGVVDSGRPSGPVGPIDSNPTLRAPQRSLEHQIQDLLLSAAKAVVDGVLDGGRQGNRRTTRHQADGRHQILGREQHRRTTAQRTDDQRQTTDLAVGGSSPSRRATFPQVSRYVFANPRSS